MNAKITAALVLLLSARFLTCDARSEEGMFLFTNPPTPALARNYGFRPDAAWLDRVQKSCVRFGRGGSASFVSPQGLVMTNHHVGRGQLQRLSTKERDLLADGFHAQSAAQEIKCPDVEVNVLRTIKDVTDRVKSAVKSDMTPAQANQAQRRRIAMIESEAEDRTGLNCDVVTLYHGARYHLYAYQRYTDVRLVMAPEGRAAHFGGDTDNFEYPRYCLDMCFFRVYADGEPIRSEHYLPWSPSGAEEGELIFVTGHPGRTQRLYTVDHLVFQRDVAYPAFLSYLWRREVQLLNFSADGAENTRIAQSALMGVQNGRKAVTGMYAGLIDPQVMKKKRRDERGLRAAVAANPDWATQWSAAWAEVAEAQKAHESMFVKYNMLSGRMAFGGSRLFQIARLLVRMAEELPKPSEERLPAYQDAALDSTKLRLFSPAPVYDSLEIDSLTSGISFMAEQLGGDDPLVVRVLDGKTPRARAVELVGGSGLANAAARRQLAEGGKPAIAASNDPMIRLAHDLDPQARALQKRYEDEVEGAEREAYEKIGAARFAVHGEDIPPDATGTLRMAYGTISGYTDGRTNVPAFTTFAGMHERHQERRDDPAFALSKKWLDGKENLDLETPYNFVCTADVVGGNSGSPVINANGQVVGLVFDGNIHTLVWNTAYTDRVARTVAVDSRAIIESLRKIYGADKLADEIQGG